MGKVRGGDANAFKTLFAELHEPVHAYLDRRCRDSHDTEDLVATVFHNFLCSVEKFDSQKGSVIGWVMTMARNALIDHLRRQRETVDVDSLSLVLAGPGADPLESVIRNEQMEQVRLQLGQLPHETRELLALRYGEGLTHPEIAAITGLREKTVRKRASRAVKTLREKIAGMQRKPGGGTNYATL